MNKSNLSNALKIFGYIVIVFGIIAGFLVLQKLSQGNMFAKAEITPTTVIIAILVAFYHGVFGMLCLGMSALLDRPNSGRFLNQSADSESIATGSVSFKKCSKCGKEYASDFAGEFCEECGAHF